MVDFLLAVLGVLSTALLTVVTMMANIARGEVKDLKVQVTSIKTDITDLDKEYAVKKQEMKDCLEDHRCQLKKHTSDIYDLRDVVTTLRSNLENRIRDIERKRLPYNRKPKQDGKG